MTGSQRIRFVDRLAQAPDWTPELRDYARRYLLNHTTRASIYGVLDVAHVEAQPGTILKTDNVELLLSGITPPELAATWRNRSRRGSS